MDLYVPGNKSYSLFSNGMHKRTKSSLMPWWHSVRNEHITRCVCWSYRPLIKLNDSLCVSELIYIDINCIKPKWRTWGSSQIGLSEWQQKVLKETLKIQTLKTYCISNDTVIWLKRFALIYWVDWCILQAYLCMAVSIVNHWFQ